MNAANCIFRRPTPVAMATKFGTKLAITQLCKRPLVFRNGPLNVDNQILPRPTLVAMATKFKTKWAQPRLVQQISPRSLHLMEVRVESLAVR